MPRYRITLSDGRVVTLEAAAPPSEADVLTAIGDQPVNVGSRASFTVNNRPVMDRGQTAPGPAGGAPFSAEEFTPPTRVDTSDPSVMDEWPTRVARASRALPAIGGAVGGALGTAGGPPGIIGGAALGGAAGESFSQLIRLLTNRDNAESPTEAATGIMEQSALQVPMELGGRAVMGGARVLGRTLYDAALRPSATLLQEFPDVVKTALRERLPVGDLIPGITKRGSQMARDARKASSQETTEILEKAGTRGGVRFQIRDVVEKPIQALAKQIDNQPEMRSDLAALGKFTRELLADKSGDLTPLRLKAIKQSAQSVANPIYKAQARGNAVTASQSLSAKANSAVADGAKKQLETIGGIADSEAKTQALIGAFRAIRQAEARRAPLTTHILSGVAGGAGIGGGIGMGGSAKDDATLGLMLYVLMRVAASPRTMSRAGIVLTRDGVQEALRLLPYAAEGAYSTMQETSPRTAPETLSR